MKFNYIDGGEQKLLEIFKSENFDESSTWKKYTYDWALYYHLSPLRKNLLSWIDTSNKSNLNILELGAGCGAITSGLCKLTNISSHVAIEGSVARANLIKERCSQYSHLEVINSNFEDYNTDKKFDYVFIIGVLEYSGKYIKDDNPYQKFLDHASSFLKDDGILVLAIENQLGHKYLAGYNEDHHGKPYVGLSGYPESTGIETFDKNTLNKMLSKSGLMHNKYYYPFPDYKLPKVILSEAAFKTDGFNALDILDFPTSDQSSLGVKPNFNEKKCLEILQNVADVGAFMNSFLIFSSKKEIDSSNEFLAAKFNTERASEFQTSKFFRRNNDSIEVQSFGKENLIEPYYRNHKNLFSLLIDSYLGNNVDFDDYFQLWLNIIDKVTLSNPKENGFESFCKENIKTNIYENEKEWVPSKYLDLIPNNILVDDKDKSTKIIDQEWDLDTGYIPKKLILDRGVFYLINNIKKYKSVEFKVDNKWNIPVYLSCDENQFRDFNLFENWFQNHVKHNGRLIENDKNDIEIKEKLTIKHRLAMKLAKVAARSKILRKMAEYITK